MKGKKEFNVYIAYPIAEGTVVANVLLVKWREPMTQKEWRLRMRAALKRLGIPYKNLVSNMPTQISPQMYNKKKYNYPNNFLKCELTPAEV